VDGRSDEKEKEKKKVGGGLLRILQEKDLGFAFLVMSRYWCLWVWRKLFFSLTDL